MEYKLEIKPKARAQTGVTVAIADIRAAISRVRDPRRSNGRRYSLSAMLSLAMVAMLCNHLSVTAMAEWASDLSEELKQALGLRMNHIFPFSLRNFLPTIKAAAAKRGITFVEKPVSKFDTGKVIPQLKGSEAQGLICLEASILYSDPQVLKNTVAQEKLQVVGVEKVNLDNGLLFTYGINNFAMGRQTAQFVDKALHGANVAELPIQNPDKLELALNQKVADQLGIKFPEAVLAAADQVLK